MPIKYQRHIRRADLQANPASSYVFGGNFARKGFGGQAAEMRAEPNAFGLITKVAPNNRPDSFLVDENLAAVVLANRHVGVALIRALEIDLTVVIPTDGIGTGLADLPRRAPKIAAMYANLFYSWELRYGLTADSEPRNFPVLWRKLRTPIRAIKLQQSGECYGQTYRRG